MGYIIINLIISQHKILPPLLPWEWHLIQSVSQLVSERDRHRYNNIIRLEITILGTGPRDKNSVDYVSILLLWWWMMMMMISGWWSRQRISLASTLSLWKVYKFHHSDIISTQERLGHNTTGLDGDDWTGLDRQGSNNQLKLGLPVCAVYLPTGQLKLLLL